MKRSFFPKFRSEHWFTVRLNTKRRRAQRFLFIFNWITLEKNAAEATKIIQLAWNENLIKNQTVTNWKYWSRKR